MVHLVSIPLMSNLLRILVIRSLAPMLLVLIAGCAAGSGLALPYVDMDERQALPEIIRSDVIPLRLAVAAIISPQGNAESYSELAHYLGQYTNRPIEVVQRKTYAEVNQLIEENQVDVGFVCTSAYIHGHDAFGMELLVAPEINGESLYYSELIVPTDSEVFLMADLQGKTFAFTDPMSFTGRVYPSYLVQQLGFEPTSFFKRVFFTYSHDLAIEAVVAGLADGAAVDSLVLDYAISRDPTLAKRIRIIHRSDPFGIPPVVVPPDLAPKQKLLLREALLTMHDDSLGQTILTGLGIDRFVPIDDSAYTKVRELIQEVGG